MSLGIVFKGPEGIVLGADSRVTLQAQIPGQPLVISATYDNATKLLQVAGQEYIGVVTYGLAAIGEPGPRTAQSFLPEFEADLAQEEAGRLSVSDFAARLSKFFMERWAEHTPSGNQGQDMVFLVAGYDEGAPYGRVLEVGIPSKPEPREHFPDLGVFGLVWGGQPDFVNRLFRGFDDGLLAGAQQHLKLTDEQRIALGQHLQQRCNVPIPYQFLPLQDCVDLVIFSIRATVAMQSWYVGLRGVGGAADVATITRTDGIKFVQQKIVSGERT